MTGPKHLEIPANLNWDKGGGLLPAIVQHASDGTVLMLGYMNPAALQATCARGRVVFYSRGRQRLWEKGETSGHHLRVHAIHADCDRDTLLILAEPAGPVCHRGTRTCFPAAAEPALTFLAQLQAIIENRMQADPQESYTARMRAAGMGRIAQKIGEEGVEVALAAVGENDSRIVSESADLLYHLLLLLKSRNLSLQDVARELQARHVR